MSISNFYGTRTFDSATKTINNVRICTSWSRHVNFIFNLGALKFPMQCYIISHTKAVSVLPSPDYSMSLAIASELPTWRNVSPFIFVGQRLNLQFVYISLLIKRQWHSSHFTFYVKFHFCRSAYILKQESLPPSYKSFLNKHSGKDSIILQGVKQIASGMPFTYSEEIENYYKGMGEDIKLDPEMKVPCSVCIPGFLYFHFSKWWHPTFVYIDPHSRISQTNW